MRLMLLARFVLIGLVLNAGLSWAYLRYVCPEHEAWVRDARYLERDADIKVLVVGASHAHMAVRAHKLPGVLNIATHGEHYLRTRYRLEWLLDQDHEGIETVLVSFDDATFSGFKTDHFRPEAVWGRYVPYLDLARQGKPTLYADMWFRSRFVPYAGEIDTVSQFLGRQRAFRRRWQRTGATVEAQTAAQIAERHFPTPGDTFSEEQARALLEIIAMLKARDIRVVLVSYPVHEAYARQVALRGVDSKRRLALAQELIEPGVVDHLDHTDLWPDKRLLYADPDHLSPLGALAYTRHLNQELQGLGVLEGM